MSKASRTKSARLAELKKHELTPQERGAIWHMLDQITQDPHQHATFFAQGKINFRNRYNLQLEDVKRKVTDLCRTKQATNYHWLLLYLTARRPREAVLQAAWQIFSEDAWKLTLTQVSRDIGCDPGNGLPETTTPDMILRFLHYLDDDEPEDPEGPDFEVEIMLPEHDVQSMWRSSGRTRRGKYHEIMGDCKMPDIQRGIAAGTHRVRRMELDG